MSAPETGAPPSAITVPTIAAEVTPCAAAWLTMPVASASATEAALALPDHAFIPTHLSEEENVEARRNLPPPCDRSSSRVLSLIHISEPTRLLSISYAVF